MLGEINMGNETKLIETIRKGYTEELWYDWFCKDSALENRGKKLFKKMKEIAFSSKINLENNYVFFKNNAKLSGKMEATCPSSPIPKITTSNCGIPL